MTTSSVSNTSECCICLETFKTPKILSCGHTFCLVCIEGYIGDKNETFPCPTCNQDVKIPQGGAKEFITNYIAQNNQPPSTTQPKCPNHKQREVDYYCNNCNVGMCLKCIFKQHKDHETLDIECDETRNEAIEKLQSSQKIIQNRIKDLKETRSSLLESFEQLKSLCEHSCTEMTVKTEQILSDLRTNCENIKKDIRKNLEENRSKVEDRVMKITSDIDVLESYMVSIISPSAETTLNMLLTLPRLIEIENLGENRKDYNLCIQYLQWVGKDFSLDIDQLGSVISKSFYIPGSYQFIFDVRYIGKDETRYYSTNKFKYNNLVWSCYVGRIGSDNLYISIKLLEVDNPKLDYCIIDGTISLLNIDDKTVSEKRVERGGHVCLPVTWSELTDENNGCLNSKGQFVVQCDISKIREIKFLQ